MVKFSPSVRHHAMDMKRTASRTLNLSTVAWIRPPTHSVEPGTPRVQNITICDWFLRIGLRSSARRQYSESSRNNSAYNHRRPTIIESRCPPQIIYANKFGLGDSVNVKIRQFYLHVKLSNTSQTTLSAPDLYPICNSLTSPPKKHAK